MFFNNLALFTALGISEVIVGNCSNGELSVVLSLKRKIARFIDCKNGKEVEAICKAGEKFYGNGDTNTICIDALAFGKRQKLLKRYSDLAGYEPSINNFNSGLYGNSNSFGVFITNMRSIMFVDKNASSGKSMSIN
ncbi:hypothetical protein BB561_001645 [Smittium simulii]|uniref:Uncharacterized protein n=1 Tax=Smittium simulii TaxID=133385 RepID=A0A2T9YTQ0_9FUNG|nr:hypothetical protein BB561_001645 [Smittium simulii]